MDALLEASLRIEQVQKLEETLKDLTFRRVMYIERYNTINNVTTNTEIYNILDNYLIKNMRSNFNLQGANNLVHEVNNLIIGINSLTMSISNTEFMIKYLKNGY